MISKGSVRAGESIGVVGLSLLAGAATSLGRPGLEWIGLHLLAMVAWLAFVIRQPSIHRAALGGVFHGAALLCTVCIGGIGWGFHVLAAFVVYGTLVYSVPLALWLHWASRRLTPLQLFAATAALFALLMDATDWLYAPKAEALALVRVAPWLAGGARLFGANVLQGLLVASLGLSAAQLAIRAPWRAAGAIAAGLGLVGASSLLGHLSAESSARQLSAGIVQLNVPERYYIARMASPRATERLNERVAHQLAQLTRSELLVFSESYEERYPLLFPAIRAAFAERSRHLKQATLLSSYLVDDRGDRTNVVALLNASGKLVGTHQKVDLVPLGEKGVTPGTGYEPLRFDEKLSIGVMICNEAILPKASHELARKGAGLLVVSTDDGSFYDSVVVFEHLANAQLRAIEVGRDVVWASNRGPSGRITRFGAFEATTVLGAAQASQVTASAYGLLTPFLRTRGLWPALQVLVLLTCLLLRRRVPVSIPSATLRVPAWRTLLAGCAGAVLICLISPALVRANYGHSAQTWAAIGEVLWPKPPSGEPGGYARFTTGKTETLRGALAYLLSYYGPDRDAQSLPEPLPDGAMPHAVQAYLARHFGLKSHYVPLDDRAPSAAALVQRKDGKYTVISANENLVFFFFPENGASGVVPFSELAPHLRSHALVPQKDY